MKAVEAFGGVVTPAGFLALLASSAEGSEALAEFGLKPQRIGDEFEALKRRARTEQDAAPRDQAAVAEWIVAHAAQARGWLSVRGHSSDVVPAMIIAAAPGVLVAQLHGSLVEWMSGGVDLAAEVVRASVQQSSDSDLVVTTLAGGEALCGARFHAGRVDVSARKPDCLGRLSSAAASGLGPLVAAMLDELGPGDGDFQGA